MSDMTVNRRLEDATRADVQTLLGRIADADGFWPLSDQLDADLNRPPTDDLRSPIFVVGGDRGRLWGYAQGSRREGGWTMQVATRRDDGASARVQALAGAVVSAIDDVGVGDVDWWVFEPGDGADDVAAAVGFGLDRDLLQMHRDLPAERRAAVATRSFDVGRDEQAWLAVNNRAFEGHAEQGGWTLETVRQRMDQPWFDPHGLRLHERDGRLAAFCWTKIHEAAVRTGEIYVIAVDPDFQGLGLGRELTLAGLDHMVDIGVGHGMLYVDGANEAASTLYRRLGFEVKRTDRAFRRPSRVAP